MSDEEKRNETLLETTDCLEAIGVFKGMKNFLCLILVLCLVTLQICFWLVDLNFVEKKSGRINCQKAKPVSTLSEAQISIPLGTIVKLQAETEVVSPVPQKTEQIEAAEIEAAAKAIAGEDDKVQQSAAVAEQKPAEETQPTLHITFVALAWLIRLCNYILILAAILYCLTLMFSLKISLTGRLGGINHISRAFFLSLFMLVFLLPWQRFFGGITTGAIYAPSELMKFSCSQFCSSSVICTMLYYLRFVGLWMIAALLLVVTHIRTARWARATLRRLELI